MDGYGLLRMPRKHSSVYSTAPEGLRTRIAGPVAARARRRRHERLFALTQLKPSMRILDVGCGALGLRALEPDLDITGLDARHIADYPGTFIQGEATNLPFEDGAFDLVHCSSVIEHLPRASQIAMAKEIKRVGRGYLVQTPAYSFPIEPHALIPFAHWLPSGPRRVVWERTAVGPWEEVHLLKRHEVADLFGHDPIAERMGPLVKSWTAVRAIP